MIRCIFIIFISSFSISSFSNIKINEVLVSNSCIITDPDFNQFSDWIELYNNGPTDINIKDYYLTDDLSQPNKFRISNDIIIKAGEYLLIWADKMNSINLGIHTNFKLNSDSEEIGIYDNNGTLLDVLIYNNQKKDISLGVNPSGYNWLYYETPTPGYSNETIGKNTFERNEKPLFAITGGLYENSISLSFLNDSINTKIRYTVDGSIPSNTSSLYTTPIVIDKNTIIRARTFSDTKLQSKVSSESYFINENTNLPVLSVVCDPDFLWDNEIGFYVDENIASRKEWERTAEIELFSESGESQFKVDSDIRLFGNSAYELPQKSLAVFPNKTLQYKLFEDKELQNFNSFLLRSSSDDWSSTMYRDGMIQSLIKNNFKIDYQAYKPCVVYLNGEYYGIHNIREKYNEDYCKFAHNVDSLDLLFINLYGHTTEVLEGDSDHYWEMYNYISTNDMNDSTNYNKAKTYFNVDNYIDYLILQIYMGNRSWRHNIRAWRPKTDNGKWEWLIFDLDRGYSQLDHKTLDFVYTVDPMLSHLLNNKDFYNEFVQRFACHMGISVNHNRVTSVIDSLKNNIIEEMPSHIERWKDVGGIGSVSYWEDQIQIMRDFSEKRKDTMYNHFETVLNLENTYNLTLIIDSPEYGTVDAMGITTSNNKSVIKCFSDIPVRLLAKTKNHSQFLGWKGISLDDSISLTINSDTTIIAQFASICHFQDTITTDVVFFEECSPYYINNDLYISKNGSLTVQPGVEIIISENKSIIVDGDLYLNGDKNKLITIKSNQGYWGEIKANNANISIDYTEVRDAKNFLYVNFSNTQVKNSTIYESDLDLVDLISIYAGDVTFENNTIYGSLTNIKTDCIDCAAINSGNFINNNIYNVSDDGIDIGTNSTNVLIEGNFLKDIKSMGISLGEGTKATIKKNIIVNCEAGIQVHTGAESDIINNTLYNNDYAIRCYHYITQPESGGKANIVNTIFSNSLSGDIDTVENSIYSISYSLSDKELHKGDSNIFGDPKFTDVNNDNFSLLENSICINRGNPSIENDPDGSQSDIGAIWYNGTSTSIIENDNQVEVFPVPFSEYINIKVTDKYIINYIRIYDTYGKLHYEKTDFENNLLHISNIGLVNGVYFIQVNIKDEGVFTKKIVFKKHD